MQDVAPPPRRRFGRTQQLFETAVNSGFDQIFKGDVIIKKLKNKHEYRITFSKVYGDRFFFYQVFNKDNTDNVNNQRFAAYITIKNYINVYNNYNAISKLNNTLVFTPTTIMELPNFSKYAFVINNMYFNSHKRLVFIVSTKEINLQNNISKKLTQIPCGKFKHVRFDIDDLKYSDYLFKTIYWIWNKIDTDCSSVNAKESKLSFKGKDYYYCGDEPLPPFPEECGQYTLEILRKDPENKCSIKLKEMFKQNLFPSNLVALFPAGDTATCTNDNCDCCAECEPPS
jgi:hypothetical protein